MTPQPRSGLEQTHRTTSWSKNLGKVEWFKWSDCLRPRPAHTTLPQHIKHSSYPFLHWDTSLKATILQTYHPLKAWNDLGTISISFTWGLTACLNAFSTILLRAGNDVVSQSTRDGAHRICKVKGQAHHWFSLPVGVCLHSWKDEEICNLIKQDSWCRRQMLPMEMPMEMSLYSACRTCPWSWCSLTWDGMKLRAMKQPHQNCFQDE